MSGKAARAAKARKRRLFSYLFRLAKKNRLAPVTTDVIMELVERHATIGNFWLPMHPKLYRALLNVEIIDEGDDDE